MKHFAVIAIVAAAALALYLGCGGSNNSNLITPDQDGGPLADGGNNNGNLCGGVSCASNQVCNESKVCVNKPTADAVAFTEKGPMKGPADVSCFTNPPATPTTFDKVKVVGCVDVFGLASNTVDLEVTYYLDGVIDKALAGPVTAVANDAFGCASSGYYEIDGIPTNTLLVRKVGCPASNTECGFHDSWQFNVYLNSAHAQNGVIDSKTDDDAIANVVSDATWNLIPRTVGISSGVQKGHGVVAGRVRDCNHDPIQNAMVGMTANPKMLVYFDGAEGTKDDQGNEKASNPDINRMSTNTDGLYAGIDLAPQQVTVSALAQVTGGLQGLGTFKVQIIPDGITILSFKGARPVAQK